MKTFNFYFDFISPFSYFAWKKIQSDCFFNDYTIQYKPVVLASLLNHVEQKGPGEIQPKREYLFRYCLRYAKQNNIEFIPPKTHPFNPLYALRLACQSCSQEQQFQVIDSLWSAAWSRRIDMGDPQELSQFLRASLPNIDELLEKTFDPTVKKELKQNTKEAIGFGAFGVPSFITQEELFWGNDSIEHLKLSLANSDPLNKELYREMLNSTPKAASQSI